MLETGVDVLRPELIGRLVRRAAYDSSTQNIPRAQASSG